jgi:acetate kinase
VTLCLVLNAGSSSVKFALFEGDQPLHERMRGDVSGLGERAVVRASMDGETLELGSRPEADGSSLGHDGALEQIITLVNAHFRADDIAAVGHRVVHGGLEFCEPCVVDDEVRAKLQQLVPLAPLHQPHNLAGIDAARARFPAAVHVAAFDTAFHRAHPWVNDVYAIPRRYYEAGVRRYGFHGLSYEFVSARLQEVLPIRAHGRVVIAHLGNGASMCALKDGRSVGSSMGFSALDGLPMGTRCGQLDPGVVLYLLESEGLSPDEVRDVLYRESGLKGLSGVSHDVRTLESSDEPAAREALDYFIFWARRELGGLVAILGGLDALVFCGGVGENSAHVRAGICAGMGWLGLEIDASRNAAAGVHLSASSSAVDVLVISTNEEQMIATHARSVVANLT